VPGLVRLLAVALLAGTALLGIGAVFHPMLAGDAAAQLHTIATTPHWRAVHLTMLAGSGLVIAGVWVRLLTDRETSGPLVAALAVVTIGIAVNALDIAFMAGSGTRMATLFANGSAEMEGVFDATHQIGQMAARFGNFIVALGAVALGWIEWRDATRPRWLAWLAWLAAAGGFVGVLFFDEASRLVLAAVALLSGWEVATAVLALVRRPVAP
jgi:uncharacterized membrane protein YhaH (DUF805 family)